ncbi:hypothetical protein BV25DRAFT_1821373 [Artomyces pyxidatus]|uniref:Uncharacterized protein n=1 Tax=Artomyces pyxidatus TaxID=48021 RepID=A0ACB8TAX5_9AGAM|nr:hypothetical protein BV25DRAFT_1821373 [Artomyces pyxidatus]
MPRLPPELWLRVIERLPDSDRLALRAADRRLHALATPAVFRELCFTSTPRSTAAIRALLGTSVRGHVEKIEYQNAWNRPREMPDQMAFIKGQVVIRDNLVGIVALLPSLPALHSLVLAFDPTTNYGDLLRRQLSAQEDIFNALASLPSPLSLRTLVLENLLPYTNDILLSPTFLAVFRGVQHLAVTCHHGSWNPADDFYPDTLPILLLGPAATLTSLSLHSNRDIGFPPGISLSDLRFPHLTHLSLQRILFDENTCAEGFILAHAAKLTSLTLHYCKIALARHGDSPARSWVVVYGALSSGLENLRHLKVLEERRGWKDNEFVLRYAVVIRSWGPHSATNWHPISGGEEAADAAALEAFSAAVQRRNLQ